MINICDKSAFRNSNGGGSEIEKKILPVKTAEELYKEWLDEMEKKHRMGKYACLQEDYFR